MSDDTATTETAEPGVSEAETADDAAASKANEQGEGLEARIAALEAEAAELKDKLLRTLAEADNVRKRAERDVADARVFAIERFAGDLLTVSDNLSRALEALDGPARDGLSDAGRGLVNGVDMTQKELHAVFARHGVTAIDAAPGAAFDPNLHQAVGRAPSQHPAGAVAQPLQSGWKIGERVLRAAMVTVSAGAPADEGGQAG